MAGDAQPLNKPRCSVLVGACSCRKYPGRRKACRDTWMQHVAPDVLCKFFVGGEAPIAEEPDVVTLPAQDGYYQLTEKGLSFYEWAVDNVEFDWLLKCDDDTYCAIDRLHTILDPGWDMIGASGYIATRGLPSGGGGYLMSRELVEYIVDNQDRVPKKGAEDCVFGNFARKHGFKIKPDWRLNGSKAPWPGPDNDHITCHWINPDVMKQIEEQYYEQ